MHAIPISMLESILVANDTNVDYKKLGSYAVSSPEPAPIKKRRRGRPSLQVSEDTFKSLLIASRDGLYELHIRGVIDGTTVLAFREVMFSAIGRQPRVLRLMLNEIDDISDVGISNLVTTARVAAMMQVGIEVIATGRVYDMLSTSGLLDLIQHPSVAVTTPIRTVEEVAPLRRAA
jgi:anti-anti-sigma regulatory factor